MSISDEELIQQLESVPLVDPPDFREAVMRGVRRADSPVGSAPAKSRRYVLGLAWAAAVAVVVGLALWRAPEPRPQNAAATIAPASAELNVHRIGDRFAVQSTLKGELEWDRTKLSKVATLPDGTTILQRRPGASGVAEIRLRIAGKEVAKTTIGID